MRRQKKVATVKMGIERSWGRSARWPSWVMIVGVKNCERVVSLARCSGCYHETGLQTSVSTTPKYISMPRQIFQSLKILLTARLSSRSILASATSAASLAVSSSFSSRWSHVTVSGQSGTNHLHAIPTIVVASPSMMKIHPKYYQPSLHPHEQISLVLLQSPYPPTPSIFAIA